MTAFEFLFFRLSTVAGLFAITLALVTVGVLLGVSLADALVPSMPAVALVHEAPHAM